MKKRTAILRALVPVVAFAAVTACSPSCEIESEHSTASPDGRFIATVFVENCHATAPYVTAVNVRCRECRFDTEDYVVSIDGTPRVELTWENTKTLVIRHETGRVYSSKARWKEINIQYEALARKQVSSGETKAPHPHADGPFAEKR
ncbi:MAG: hypothetical protein ACYC7A_20325 [Thermoanaerobaculia bacterium]